MTVERHDISGNLLDLDRGQPLAGREQYERRVVALFERKLTGGDWARLALMSVGGLAGASVCGALLLTEPAEMPLRARVALSVLVVIGLSWVALAGVIFRRGAVNSTVHGAAAATMGFAFSLLLTAAIGVMSLTGAARGASAGAAGGMLLLPLVPLVLSTVVLIVHHVNQASLRVRRDVLEMTYRLSRRAAQAGE